MKTSRIVLGCILAPFAFLAGSASAQLITEFGAGISAGAVPVGITAGPDGNLWFTEPGIDRIGRITPLGAVTEFSAGITAGAKPSRITAGPDGNLWFTEPNINRIGRITPTGVVTEFGAGISAGPVGITVGPDGNLWFTEAYGSPIGRITPTGVVTEFGARNAGRQGITAGPDGNLWFTESLPSPHPGYFPSGWIGRITPLGVVTYYRVPGASIPSDITAGPDGNLWFTLGFVNKIGRITPAGVTTEFSAGNTGGGLPTRITAGPDGNVWFLKPSSSGSPPSDIGRITPDGVVTEFGAGQLGAVGGITAGPDGNLWFTESVVFNGRIGRITTGLVATTTTTIVSSVNPSIVGQAITFTASVAGNLPTGTVQFMDGGTNLGSPVTLSGGGVAQLITSTLTQGTHPITAVYSGDVNNGGSTSSTLSQVVNGSGGGSSINVALAANGGVASASSSSFLYPPSAVNNGDRAGLNSGFGGVWKDATPQMFPDWVEIDFNGAKTIDHVIVYSVQDNAASPVDPSDTLTFTQRGITAFEAQAWNGSAWVSLGSVSGNNLVKRSVSFVATTTSKIRVLINAVAGGRYSFITEIEAWTH